MNNQLKKVFRSGVLKHNEQTTLFSSGIIDKLNMSEPGQALKNHGIISEKFVDAFPIKDMKFAAKYNRPVTDSNTRRKYNDIKNNGWLSTERIKINEKYEVIDGQNRIRALTKLNKHYAPTVILEFETYELEADYYAYINNSNTPLKSKENLLADFESKKPVGVLLYKLFGDSSLASVYRGIDLNDPVDWEGNRLTLNTKDIVFSASQVLAIISMLCLGLSEDIQSAESTKKIDSLLSPEDYSTIATTVDRFMFFYKSTMNIKLDKIIRAALSFYNKVRKSGYLKTETEYLSLVRKMKSYQLSSGNRTMNRDDLIHSFICHYDKGRQHKRLPVSYA